MDEEITTYQSVLIRDLLHQVPECGRHQVLEAARQHCADLSPALRRQVFFSVREECREYAKNLIL